MGPESPQMYGVATSGVAPQGLDEKQPTEESSVQRTREQCARSMEMKGMTS